MLKFVFVKAWLASLDVCSELVQRCSLWIEIHDYILLFPDFFAARSLEVHCDRSKSWNIRRLRPSLNIWAKSSVKNWKVLHGRSIWQMYSGHHSSTSVQIHWIRHAAVLGKLFSASISGRTSCFKNINPELSVFCNAWFPLKALSQNAVIIIFVLYKWRGIHAPVARHRQIYLWTKCRHF